MSQLQFRTIRARGVAALARGRAVVGRAIAPDELWTQLKSANSEVRRMRGQVTKQRRAVERLKAELRATRDSLIDPLPGLELPEHVAMVIKRVRGEHLTYLGVPQLTVLARQVYDVDLSGREGLIIEAGTARGGSAIAMAAAKDPIRPMKVYDVFGQIPPPSDDDGTDVQARYQTISEGGARGIGGDTYYGYRDNLYGEVAESFARLGVPIDENNVELVKGLFEDTIQIDEPVAFAHLDGDWYESTMTCLERITPLLIKGGRIVLDDYFHWSGCRKAVDDYFAHRTGYQLERRNKIHVVKL
jgi:O-methyltransferase